MKFENRCVKAVSEKFPDLEKPTIEKMVKGIWRDTKRAKANGDTRSELEVIQDSAGKFLAQSLAEAKQAKRSVLLESQARINANAQVERFVTEVTKNTDLSKPVFHGRAIRRAITGILVGHEDGFGFGGMRSTAADMRSQRDKFMGKLIGQLEKANLLKMARSGKLDADIARELGQIRTDGAGQRGLTKNVDARLIADIIDDVSKYMIGEANKHGAAVRFIDNFIATVSHERQKLMQHDRSVWIAEVKPLQDWKAIDEKFDLLTDKDRDSFLEDVWTNITLGRKVSTRSGRSTLTDRIASDRALLWKDADAFMAYRHSEKFGTKVSLFESVVKTIGQTGDNVGLLQRWGSDPERAMKEFIADQLNKHRDNPELQKKIAKGNARWDKYIAMLMGDASMPESHGWARQMANVRGWISMAKMGMSPLSSLTDLPSKFFVMRDYGAGFGEALGDAFTKFGKGTEAQREFVNAIGMALDSQTSDFFGRFAGADDAPGRFTSGMMTRYFKAIGLTKWTESNQHGLLRAISNLVGRRSDLEFGALPDDLQVIMKTYGVEPAEWDLIRSRGIQTIDGEKFLSPEGIAGVSDDVIKDVMVATKPGLLRDEITARQANLYRDDIELKIRTMLIDSVTHGIIEPTIKQRTWLTQARRPGSVIGEVIRFVTQFKSFPATFMSRVLGRRMSGRGAGYGTLGVGAWLKNGGPAGLANVVIATTIMGYISWRLKEMVLGRTPPDPRDIATWSEAMVRGGGLGLWADLFSAKTNTMGAGPIEALTGPGIGTLTSLYTAYQVGRDKGAREGLDRALAVGKGLIPFQNVWYTKYALDYMMMNEINEWMSPGWKKRLEKRLEERGQQLYLPM